jgi:hypothetical protein
MVLLVELDQGLLRVHGDDELRKILIISSQEPQASLCFSAAKPSAPRAQAAREAPARAGRAAFPELLSIC